MKLIKVSYYEHNYKLIEIKFVKDICLMFSEEPSSPLRPAPPPPIPPRGVTGGVALPGLANQTSLPETPSSPPPQVRKTLRTLSKHIWTTQIHTVTKNIEYLIYFLN